jgi:hypothetical protein
MIELNSSVIEGVDYDETAQRLTVYFRGGRAYDHPGVPVAVFLGLLTAVSAGRFYNAQIRGRYR